MRSETSSIDRATGKPPLILNDQRQRVLTFIIHRGTFGATDKEIQTGLPMCGDTERPRRRELERGGLIRESSRKRGGCKVWIAIDAVDGKPIEERTAGGGGTAAQRAQPGLLF